MYIRSLPSKYTPCPSWRICEYAMPIFGEYVNMRCPYSASLCSTLAACFMAKHSRVNLCMHQTQELLPSSYPTSSEADGGGGIGANERSVGGGIGGVSSGGRSRVGSFMTSISSRMRGPPAPKEDSDDGDD